MSKTLLQQTASKLPNAGAEADNGNPRRVTLSHCFHNKHLLPAPAGVTIPVFNTWTSQKKQYRHRERKTTAKLLKVWSE